jgi:hypothetical protein
MFLFLPVQRAVKTLVPTKDYPQFAFLWLAVR